MFQFLATIASVVLIAADQIIKNWAQVHLAGGDDIEIVKDILYLRYTENTGVAFSMFEDMRWLLIAVTGVMLLAVLGAFLSGKVANRWHIAALSLILAGGVGNLIDRISLGYVIDYIDFRAIRFAIFNLADACITVGAVLLCLSVLFQDYWKTGKKGEAMAGIPAMEPDPAWPEGMEGRETLTGGAADPVSDGVFSAAPGEMPAHGSQGIENPEAEFRAGLFVNPGPDETEAAGTPGEESKDFSPGGTRQPPEREENG